MLSLLVLAAALVLHGQWTCMGLAKKWREYEI